MSPITKLGNYTNSFDIKVLDLEKVATEIRMMGVGVDNETKRLVRGIAEYSKDTLKREVPVGTGNLRDAIKISRHILGPGEYENKVYISGDKKPGQRDPRLYAMALERGTRQIIRPPGHPLVLARKMGTGQQKEKNAPGQKNRKGLVFTYTRKPTPGKFFFLKTKYLTAIKAQEMVAKFHLYLGLNKYK